MVEANFLYRLGRLIPAAMMDDLLAMDRDEAIRAVQSLPHGEMPEYADAFKELQKPKKAAPKKKAASKKKAKKE